MPFDFGFGGRKRDEFEFGLGNSGSCGMGISSLEQKDFGENEIENIGKSSSSGLISGLIIAI